MPKTTQSGKPKPGELPGTLKRSPKTAQRTFAEVHDSAAEQYGEGERAHRTAYAAVKHSFKKVGDHWEAKDRKGPSDPRSKNTTAEKREGNGETFAGIDLEGSSRDELYRQAADAGIAGRSKMNKLQLARALARKG